MAYSECLQDYLINMCTKEGRALLNLKELIDSFFLYAEAENIEIYNEFSFQHELGIFLRKVLEGYTIQFERNISYFSINSKTIKKEIDISIFNKDKSEKYAIELKCPDNGQYPEQMYLFVEDAKFMEELKESGFTKTATVVIVSDKLFYTGREKKGIYKYFRVEHKLYGDIFKPTGKKKGIEYITLNSTYDFSWLPILKNSRYYIIEI